jgi:microsomal dipeptidase-like Zn-dependent dipeptidase
MQGGTKAGVDTVARQVKKLGAEHFIIGSDFGVYTLPTPVEGLREFIACLLDLGVSTEEIQTMVRDNPAALIGIDV